MIIFLFVNNTSTDTDTRVISDVNNIMCDLSHSVASLYIGKSFFLFAYMFNVLSGLHVWP